MTAEEKKAIEKKLMEIQDIINDIWRKLGEKPMAKFQEQESENLEEKVTYLLRCFGVPTNIKGYNYLKEATIIAVQYKEMPAITKVIYPKVAEMFDSTPHRVEKNMRRAIEVAWGRCPQDLMEIMFGYTVSVNKSQPSNSQFISRLVERLKTGI